MPATSLSLLDEVKLQAAVIMLVPLSEPMVIATAGTQASVLPSP